MIIFHIFYFYIKKISFKLKQYYFLNNNDIYIKNNIINYFNLKKKNWLIL